MELSALKFVADTTELERASKVIAGLVTDVSKLDKASRDAAQTEAILAKAAKSNADANLQNAKAQDVRLKSTITADKADKANEKSVAKKTKAIEKDTEAAAKNVGVLQRQTDILEFQTKGFSKGQSSILAYGKAAGLAVADMESLAKVLETQRKLMGGDPFDKSSSGLKSLQNQYTELKESVRQYNTDSDLTAKQARELARDKERLIEKMKVEGASFSDIRTAVRAHNQEYVNLAAQYNKLSSAEDAVVKSRKEVAAATNYLTTADAKMASALSVSNAAFDKGGTDSLVRYETALQKSGLAQDVVTKKLATYRTQLSQVQAQEQKRSEQYLARAASPQLTDLAVSLYSGQAPLTVLLQQGGQLADQLRLSGVEAARFSAILKESFYSMVPVIKQVSVGLTGLVSGMFIDAGKGVTQFVGNITGITLAMEIAKRAIASTGEENFKYIASMQKLGNVASGVSAGGLAALLAILIAMAVEYKNIVQAEGELFKALATSGGAIGISKDQAVAYAESMQAVGVGTLKAMNAITEFTKAGKIGKEGLDGLIKSAINLEKYAGVPIEETAKKFAKLQDEPTKALIEFTEANGQVSKSVLDVVASLEQQGDKSKAVEAATRAMEAANNSMAEEAKANLSPIETLWNDIKSAIGRVKQEIYDLTTSNDVIGAMRTVWETISVVVAEVWFTLKGVGTEIRGIAAQLVAVMQGDFQGAKNIGDMMKADAATARAEQDKLVQSILNRGQAEKKVFNDSKEQNSQYAAWRKDNEKALEKQYSKSERLAQKEKQLQADVTAGIIDETKATQALAGWKRIIMGEDKEPEVDRQPLKDLETEIDLRNQALGLLGSFNNELDAIERRRAKSGDEEQYQKSLNALIEKQPIYLERQKEINAAHNLTNKLFGKADMLGKDYYKTLEQINREESSGLRSPENAEKARQAAFDQTQLAKEQLKYIEDSTTAYNKYKETAQQSLDASKIEAQNLQNKEALLGLSVGQQKLLTIEQQKQLELTAADFKLRKELASIDETVRQGKMDPGSAVSARIEAEKATAAEILNINTKAAADVKTAWQSTFDDISGGSVNRFAESLRDAGNISFANVISSIDKLSASMTSLVDTQLIYNAAKEAAKGDTVKLAAIDRQHALAQINSYANITGAMKGFFKEGSKGYKTIQTAEKLFRAYEAAMAIKNAALKIGLQLQEIAATTAAQATLTGVTATGEAARNAIKIPGVFAAFMSMLGPWGIPAAVAALAAVGLATSGGSAQVPTTNQGTGTVFGDSEAKSESIANSLDILEDVNTLTMKYSAEMLKSLRSIESALTGVTNIILRSAGIEESARGVVPGTVASGFGKFLSQGLDWVPIIGKPIAKLLASLFGTKTTITGQGVMANDATIQEIVNGQLSAGYYTDINKKKKFLGMTTSDKNSTNFDESEELSRQFALIINGFVDVVRAAGPILGVSLDQIDASLSGFIVKIGKIDLKDLKGDEIKEKLLAVFGAAGDDIAMQTLKGFEKYQESGEGYLETITRVASTVESARGTMDTLNSSMLLTVDGAMGLVEAFGGLEAFLQTTSSYLNAYYTEEERMQTLARQGSAALKFKGIEISTEDLAKLSNAQVRAWVESFEGNNDLYAWAQGLAVNLAPLYELDKQVKEEPVKYTDTSDDTSDALKKANDLEKTRLGLMKSIYTLEEDDVRLKETIQSLRALELAQMDVSLQGLQQQLWTLEDANAEMQKYNSLRDEGVKLEIERLRILGFEEEALSMEREIAIKGMNDQQKAMWDANKTASQLNTTLREQQAAMERIKTLLPQVFEQFMSPEAFKKYQYEDVAKKLISAGIFNVDLQTATNELMNATKQQIADVASLIWNTVDLSTAQREALLQSVSTLGTLKDVSINAAKEITDAFKNVGDDIVAYIRELATGRAGLATPTELLAKTREVYSKDLAAAQGGDLSAAQRLVDSARSYIDAQKEVTASSSITDSVIKAIMGQLSSLGFVQEQMPGMHIPQYANGGVFSNSIVTSPTRFNIGEMGEDGAEAIMPLVRTSSGSLGVSSDNSQTNELLKLLITEIQDLKAQQSAETNAQITVAVGNVETLANNIASALDKQGWKETNKPKIN